MRPFFLARLTARRVDLPADMTAEEAAVMQRHGAFLGDLLARGALVVAGPVLDPSGAFGLAVLAADSLAAARALLDADPANAVGRHDVAPMASALARTRPA